MDDDTPKPTLMPDAHLFPDDELAGDPNYLLFKTGTIQFEELANILNDYLSTKVPGADHPQVRVVFSWDMDWKYEPNAPPGSLPMPTGTRCHFRIHKPVADFTPARFNPEAIRLAKQAMEAHPNLVKAVQERNPGALNTLVGFVMKELMTVNAAPQPELALELIVNILEIDTASLV